MFRHNLESVSTILFNSGVYTRNWPRIGLQPLEFNFEFYFWRFRGVGGGGVELGVLLSSSKESK